MARKSGKTSDRHRAVARDYLSGGKSLEHAMADHDFSPAYGRQGLQNVTRASRLFREAFNQELEAAMQVADGADLKPDRLAKLAIWRLATNLVRGKDEASQSAKLIGNLKTVDLFVRHDNEPAGILAAILASKELDSIALPSASATDQVSSAGIGGLNNNSGEAQPQLEREG